MKKFFYTIVVLTGLFFSAKAQYDTEVDFGLRLKHGIVRFSDLDPGEIKDQGGKFNSSSWAVGGFLQMRVNHFYFQPELVYNRTTTVLGNELGLPEYNFGEYDIIFHQMEVPLLIGYRTGFENSALRFGAGPVVNYLFAVDSETRLTRTADGGIDILPYPFEDEVFNTITIAWRFGIGYDLGPLVLDVKYERTFSKLNQELQRTTPFSFGRDNSFVFAVGYKLTRTKL